MTTAISEQDVQDRRKELQAEQVQLERRRPGLAVRKEGGDSAAANELAQVTARLAALQTELEHQDLVAAGIAEQRAQARQAQLETERQAAEARRQQAETAYQAARAERDAVAIDALEEWLVAGADLIRRGMEAGQQVDELRPATGRPHDGSAHAIETPKAMAQRVHSRLTMELDRVLPGLGLVFVNGGPPREGTVPALSRPAPAPPTLPLPPDRFKRREFAPTSTSLSAGPVEQREGAVYSIPLTGRD